MLGAIDPTTNRAVYRICGEQISDAQWSHYTEMFARLGRGNPGDGPPPCLVCIAEAGSEMPPARVRRQFAEVAAEVRDDAIFVLVAEAVLGRGIVMAVNWIRPFHFRYEVTATWAEALDIACRLDPSPSLRGDLERLFREARPILA